MKKSLIDFIKTSFYNAEESLYKRKTILPHIVLQKESFKNEFDVY